MKTILLLEDQEIDIVNGYDTGADDYITKPFSVNILVSKVNAFMRWINENGKEILLSEGIEVSIKEMQLLICLLENAGRILSRENILERVWDTYGQGK